MHKIDNFAPKHDRHPCHDHKIIEQVETEVWRHTHTHMGRSAEVLLAQVRAAQGGIAAAEVLSSTTAQTGAKGRGTGTKPGQHSWAAVARGASIDDAGATNGSHYTKDLQHQHRFPARAQDWETSHCIVVEPTTDSRLLRRDPSLPLPWTPSSSE